MYWVVSYIEIDRLYPDIKTLKFHLITGFVPVLCLSLREMGFLTAATVRSNRMQKCQLPCELILILGWVLLNGMITYVHKYVPPI